MKVLIDNGHGASTPGKRSPDSSLKEWEWNRQLAHLVELGLTKRGIDCRILVPEDDDIPLTTRANRANYWCDRLGASNVCLVSIHVNAAGNGCKWMTATGWSAYTSKGKTKGDELANCLYRCAEKELKGKRIRKDMSDGDPDWEENFTILTKTKCPACLVENFFMDNKDDVAFLLSDDGKISCAIVIINGIIDYINQMTKK